jgi:hypothetical protein
MADYCTVADVKPVLHIAADDLTYDVELAKCVTSSSALIDGLLKKEDLTVPAVVPQLVVDVAKYFAAWLFRHPQDPTSAEAFWVEANRFLDAYISVEGEVAFKVCQA